MPERRPLVLIDGRPVVLPIGDTLPGSGGGGGGTAILDFNGPAGTPQDLIYDFNGE
jgi:hypothetical protein